MNAEWCILKYDWEGTPVYVSAAGGLGREWTDDWARAWRFPDAQSVATYVRMRHGWHTDDYEIVPAMDVNEMDEEERTWLFHYDATFHSQVIWFGHFLTLFPWGPTGKRERDRAVNATLARAAVYATHQPSELTEELLAWLPRERTIEEATRA